MNWLAILASAVATFMIGWVWYGVLFKKPWMESTGMTEEKAQESNMALVMGVTFIFAAMAAMFLYGFVWHEGEPESHNFGHGAAHGAILAAFVVLPTVGTHALYEQKSLKYILINVGYWLVSFAVMGGIVNIWR